MNVQELFDHFRCLFDKIVYFDKTNNIEDSVYIESTALIDGEMTRAYSQEKQEEFLGEYGDFDVVEWEYSSYDNTINITVEEDPYAL